MKLKQKRYELHGHILVFTYNDAGVGMITLDCMDLLVDMAKNVPKRGEWIDKAFFFECSLCGYEDKKTNFCANCGADMREREGE